MKIRCSIFLIVICLGLFPVLVLVALNLPKTMERLEYAAELETQARSHVKFTQLNARVHCLKESLIRSATLPSAIAATQDPSVVATLSAVMKTWFEGNAQVKGYMLFNNDGVELLSLHRKEGSFQKSELTENHKGHPFFNQSLALTSGQVLAKLVDHQSDPFHRTRSEDYELIMSAPVVEEDLGITGIMLLRIDMSEFLKNFIGSIWVTGEGTYLRGCEQHGVHKEMPFGTPGEGCDAFSEFPGLQAEKGDDPLILTGENKHKIAWMPLV
ncbi:MAG: hypothetical protein ABFR63_08605, partial [Thermodesulfobacteriota bacterium]